MGRFLKEFIKEFIHTRSSIRKFSVKIKLLIKWLISKSFRVSFLIINFLAVRDEEHFLRHLIHLIWWIITIAVHVEALGNCRLPILVD